MIAQPNKEDWALLDSWMNSDDGWNKFLREAIGIRLDSDQRKIVHATQHNKRISVRSGNAKGKDYVSAALALCNYTLRYPSKTILTAPTGRQVFDIMMAEVSKMYRNSKVPLGGELLSTMIKSGVSDHYLVGFKAQDKNIEAWSGYHSPNIMVIATEASGLPKETFEAIEGLLQGDSKEILIFNPNRAEGEAFNSTRNPDFIKFKLNSLKSVNVRAKKILIPGQVDWEWINDKCGKPGWSVQIDIEEFDKSLHDFKWEGKYYRPSDLFLVRVLAEFPRETEDTLIPFSWIEAANKRWEEWRQSQMFNIASDKTILGIDVAGMGRDQTICVHRMGNIIKQIETFHMVRDNLIHMKIAGRVLNLLKNCYAGAIDANGEGAAVYSRLVEMECSNIISAKGSYSADGLTDITGERTFLNMRAYLHWAVRDALNPAFGFNLMLPPDDELAQELAETHWDVMSNGKTFIEKEIDIKRRIGRSPDKKAALNNTFFPIDISNEGLIEVGDYE